MDIKYNVLNLPSKITYSDGSTAAYTYSAAGDKLGVRYVTANSNVYEAYCGNFIYRAGSLKRVLVDGGYITLSGSTPHYHFYLRDHLGNNRAVVNASKTVEEVSHYYPYGGLFGENAGSDVQPYKYNGKELDRMNGLDWYDYGARHMDGALGRFTTMDPLCEKYYGISPYAYCGGNPINAIDINGDSIRFIGDKADVDYAVNVLNNYLGFNYITTDENGTLHLNWDKSSLIGISQMNQGQTLLYQLLTKCVAYPSEMTTIKLVNNSEDYIIGDAFWEVIDVGDLKNITKYTGDKYPFNAAGALFHEVYEQYQIQQNSNSISKAHNSSTMLESDVVGFYISPIRDFTDNFMNINVFELYNQTKKIDSFEILLRKKNIIGIKSH